MAGSHQESFDGFFGLSKSETGWWLPFDPPLRHFGDDFESGKMQGPVQKAAFSRSLQQLTA